LQKDNDTITWLTRGIPITFKYELSFTNIVMTYSGKSLGNKVVLAKIPREEFSRFQQYCDSNGETVNASIRRMILKEIDDPEPVKIAASSIFQYDRNKDNFGWKMILDDDRVIGIDENLPVSSVEQLFEALNKALDERNSFIRRHNKGSASFPTKLMRKMK
jgi:hypothetical protein